MLCCAVLTHGTVFLHTLQADAVELPGPQGAELWRYCFQCGKLQPLQDFDSNKR